MVRNIAVIGALHHGKTELSDLLIESAFCEEPKVTNAHKPPRYTDCRLDEINRGMSIKSAVFQMIL